jgi:predicted GIY-YIG superfamily endonuclease
LAAVEIFAFPTWAEAAQLEKRLKRWKNPEKVKDFIRVR